MSNNISYVFIIIFMAKTLCVIALELLLSLPWSPCVLHSFNSSALPSKFNIAFTVTIFHYLFSPLFLHYNNSSLI